MATWPATLPWRPLDGSVRVTPETNVAAFKPGFGSPLRRKVYTASRRLLQGEMNLTSVQKATLDTFYGTTCSDGVSSFAVRDWENLLSITQVTYSWMAEPQYTHVSGDIWRVALSFAKEP